MPLDSDKYAKQSDIIDAFGEEVADQFEFDSTTERVKNSLGMLAEYITTGISAMLVEANPSCDPFEEGEKQRAKLKLPPPKYPSAKALGYLHDMLLKRAHVAYDKTLPRSELAKLRPSNEDVDPEYQAASNQLELQRGLQDLELTEEDPNTSNRQFHGVQNLLGEFLPNHDLEQVCREVGITDWRTLELNPEHAPGKRLRPYQLIDAYDLHLKLESTMHAALLTSERGIGKTNTMLACLHISTKRLIERWETNPWPLQEQERVLKPTVYMCPSTVLDQTFTELSDWWGGYFRVHICYGTASACRNMVRKNVTLGSLKQTQQLFDQLTQDHEDSVVRSSSVFYAKPTNLFDRQLEPSFSVPITQLFAVSRP